MALGTETGGSGGGLGSSASSERVSRKASRGFGQSKAWSGQQRCSDLDPTGVCVSFAFLWPRIRWAATLGGRGLSCPGEGWDGAG